MTTDAAAVILAELAHAERPCVTSSFQAECVALVHMLRAHQPDIPVLFVDTAHHFAETLAFRDQLTDAWHLNLINVRAATPDVGRWRETTDGCCAHNKVGPLFAALESFDTWFTALRRDQSASRAVLAEATAFRLPTGRVLRKVSPLAAWTMRDVEAYTSVHEIPVLPLYARGYMSIGCEPCTSVPIDVSNPRSGRWLGRRLECGIHLESPVNGADQRPDA